MCVWFLSGAVGEGRSSAAQRDCSEAGAAQVQACMICSAGQRPAAAPAPATPHVYGASHCRQLRRPARTRAPCTAPQPTLTLGLVRSAERARLKYSTPGAPATSTSGEVKKSLGAEREAASSAGPSAAARAAARTSSGDWPAVRPLGGSFTRR